MGQPFARGKLLSYYMKMARGDPYKRKTKRDKKEKARRGRYQRGGRHRSTKIKLTGKS